MHIIIHSIFLYIVYIYDIIYIYIYLNTYMYIFWHTPLRELHSPNHLPGSRATSCRVDTSVGWVSLQLRSTLKYMSKPLLEMVFHKMFGYFHQPKMIQFDFGHNCLKVWRNERPSFCEDTLQNFACLFVVFVVPSFLWGRWWSQQKKEDPKIDPSNYQSLEKSLKFLKDDGLIKFLQEMIPTSLPNWFIRLPSNKKSESRPKRAMHFKAKIEHQKKTRWATKNSIILVRYWLGILTIVYYNPYRI